MRDGEGALALHARIRDARRCRELSLADLAERAGVSKSLISQIERGVVAPSIDTVRKLASALEAPVSALFLEDSDNKLVVRRGERQVVRYPGSHATREILSPNLHGRMIVLWATYPPGDGASGGPVHHSGEECVVVLRGVLEVMIGEQRIELGCGDSMTFDPSVPHAFLNPGPETTEAIVAIAPPSL